MAGDVLEELAIHYANIETDRSNLVECIARARNVGHSWDEIGRAMGISRQGAMVYKRDLVKL